MDYVILGILVVIVLLLAWALMRMLRAAPDHEAKIRLQLQAEQIVRLQAETDTQREQLESLKAEKVRLLADLDHARTTAAEKVALLEDAESRLKAVFENLANRILDEKGKAISEQQADRLQHVLAPLKEQLVAFRTRVDEVHQQGTAQTAQLLEQVRQLQSLSTQVSEEANQLAAAIKGDAKVQGDWGEFIVERILEASGLERDRDYVAQATQRDEQGQLQRPDFLIHLPDSKVVILDAKVSLTAYERYVAATEDVARQAALQDHIRSVRLHMKTLQEKDYSRLLGNQTLDFVIMCIPLEPAYQTVMQADTRLLYDLARSQLVITGPNTLMITLKLIAQMWRREKENRHAEEIADKAGKLYDQVSLIAEAMQDAQRKLVSVNSSFETVWKRLKGGRGNLLKRVEELRQLGAKVTKTLPADLLEDQDRDADD